MIQSSYQVNMAEIERIAQSTMNTLHQVRQSVFEPDPDKISPVFTTANVATITGLDRRRIHEFSNTDKFPSGVIPEGSNTKHFTLEETIRFVELTSKRPRRPKDQRGRIISTTVFKGGTGKTTTSLSLAQGLTLNYARKVLLIDGDPQGSLGNYMGLQPELRITERDTVMPYIYGDEDDLRYAVRKSYWHNIDIIPGNSSLYEADFHLPALYLQSDRKLKFWDILRVGLQDIAQDYDAVIIDTPPAMNYLTTNMIFGSDAILQPIPPRSVDFASAAQFWGLLSKLYKSFAQIDPDVAKKVYDYVAILPSRVKHKETNDMIISYMADAFGKNLMNNSLHESNALDNLSFLLQTIYDQAKPTTNVEDHRKYKDRMDELVDFVDRRLLLAWGYDVAGNAK